MQTFVRRPTPIRLENPCLTPFTHMISTPPSFHFPDEIPIFPCFHVLLFGERRPVHERVRTLFSDISITRSRIFTQLSACALRSSANTFLPQVHGAWNRRKRISACRATFAVCGAAMLDAATARCAGRFQWWKARWATTTPPSTGIATRFKEPYDKKPSNAYNHVALDRSSRRTT